MKRYVKSSIDLKALDLNPVFDHVKNLLGIDIDFSFRIDKDRFGKDYIVIDSENLVDRCGIFVTVLDSVYVQTFNYQATDDGYWMTLHLRYETRYGSNGLELCSCSYREGSWSFRD